MYRVGLTGNIASGKSAVAEEWRRLGACIIDADVLARRAVDPGSTGLARIAQAFGDDVIVNGALDRAALGRVVFSDAARRRELEAIVHPEVERLRKEAEASAAQRGESIVVHAIPLLFETGLDSQVDMVVLVDADEDTRRERLVSNRGLSEQDARAMIAAQAPAGPKRARADLIIDNNGTLDDLARRAREVWREILAAAA